jgi:hypothetical protein
MLLFAYCTDFGLGPVGIVYYPFMALLSPLFRSSDGLIGVSILAALSVGSVVYSAVVSAICIFVMCRKVNPSKPTNKRV